jgi:hypothetical protein
MKVSNNTISCARAEEMVTYLYGEATRDETRDFEKHMQNCSSCASELAAFGNVREAVGEWRQQSLGSFASPALEANDARHFTPAVTHARTPSALAALREFFTLSPAWMRAATAVAVVIFCALAAIAVAYFIQKPQTEVVQTPGKSGYSEKEVEEKIAEALRKQDELQVKDAPVASPESVEIADTEQRIAKPQIKRKANLAPQLANNNRRQQVVPRIVPRSSKMELASTDFLPFTASSDEEKLPSLVDLVDEDN